MDLNEKIKEHATARAGAMLDEMQARVWDAARSISAKQSKNAVSAEQLIRLYVLSSLRDEAAADDLKAIVVNTLAERLARELVNAAAEGLKQDPETY